MSVPGKGRAPLRVLFVEDSEDDAFLMLRELRRGGYGVTHRRVATAGEMRDALGERDWDVVLSDHAMPGFSAPAALQMLREEGWLDVPFIIVSGHIGEGAAVEVMKAGAHDYVPKDNLSRLTLVVERELRDAEERKQRRRDQEALREAEEKYRSIFENSVEGIFQSTLEGNLITANPAMARIFGYESPEVMVASISDISSQLYAATETREKLMQYLRRDGVVSNFEARVVSANGGEIWVSASAKVIRNEQGRAVGFDGTVEDITQRKRAQEELRAAEEKYRSIFENSIEGIFQTSPDGRFVIVNPMMARILGYGSPEEMIRTIRDVGTQIYVEPEKRQEITRLLREEGEVFEFETRFRRKDGRKIWVSINARALLVRDGSGEVVGYEGTLEDITERKKSEAALRRSLDRLVALHEAGSILGSTLEPVEIGASLLKIMRRISGFKAAAISMRDDVSGRLVVWRSIGLDGLDGNVRDTPQAREAQDAAIAEDATQIFALYPGGPSDGSRVGMCIPLRMRERLVGVLEVYGPEELAEKDVVEILESLTSQAASALENARLYGELAEREKTLQELVGKILVAQEEERRRVSYDVHDGLAQVAAAAHQHLQAFSHYHPPDTEDGREDLAHVSELVRRTVGEARRIIANLRPTALDDFGLKSAIRLHLDSLRAEGWEIQHRDGLDDERLPAATETAIFRVVQEALNNVAKHAGTKRVKLSLEKRGPRGGAGTLAPDGGNGKIRLVVRDYGHGFAEDDGGEVSGPGERVGLTGMRERISLLGGRFRVSSSPGVGTLLVAEIPLLSGPVGARSGEILSPSAAEAERVPGGAADGR